MNDKKFITQVAQRAGTNLEGAGAITYAVFQELRERITPKEAFHVARLALDRSAASPEQLVGHV